MPSVHCLRVDILEKGEIASSRAYFGLDEDVVKDRYQRDLEHDLWFRSKLMRREIRETWICQGDEDCVHACGSGGDLCESSYS
jgi:hypothetical protein